MGRPPAPDLTGLLWAKSPIFSLKGTHAFLIALRLLNEYDGEDTVAAIVLGSSTDYLHRIYSMFPLNDFIQISRFKENRIALDGGRKWDLLLLRPEKGTGITPVSKVQRYPMGKPELIRAGPSQAPISYSGRVTSVVSRDCAVLDASLLVIGLTDVAEGDLVQLMNVFKADINSHFVQSASLLTRMKPDDVFIYCPFFSSHFCKGQEWVRMNPDVTPSFSHSESFKRIVERFGTFPDREAIACACLESVWPTVSLPSLFMSLLDGEDSYLRDLNLLSLKEHLDFGVVQVQDRLTIRRETVSGQILGVVTVKEDIGQYVIDDGTCQMPIFIEDEGLVGGHATVLIEGGEVIQELFLADRITCKTVERIYLRPCKVKVLERKGAPIKMKQGASYYLATLVTCSPLMLTRIKPVIIQAEASVTLMCLLVKREEREDGILEIKGLNRVAKVMITPFVYRRYVRQLQGGVTLLLSCAGDKSLGVEAVVHGVEGDAALSKGMARVDEASFFVSREAAEHVERLSAPTSLFCDISRIMSYYPIGSLINFTGVIQKVELVEPESAVPDPPAFLKLFNGHSVGIPIPGAHIKLTIRDKCHRSVSIDVAYRLFNVKVLPVGLLLEGAVVAGRSFSLVTDCLESHANSELLVLSHQDLDGQDVEGDDGVLPFHYLVDFYGHDRRHPKCPLTATVRPEQIGSVKIRAKCLKCSSNILQACCLIHGKLSLEEEIGLEGFVALSVTDGTCDAQVECEDVESILAVLQADGLKVRKWCAAAGSLDETSSLFTVPRAMHCRRFQIKGMCMEAMQRTDMVSELAPRNYRVGRKFEQVYAYPGRIVIRAHALSQVDDRQALMQYLDLLEQ